MEHGGMTELQSRSGRSESTPERVMALIDCSASNDEICTGTAGMQVEGWIGG
jgi:hypothetical protein